MYRKIRCDEKSAKFCKVFGTKKSQTAESLRHCLCQHKSRFDATLSVS